MDDDVVKQAAVEQFLAVTSSSDRDLANQLLEAHSYDLQGAIDLYFQDHGHDGPRIEDARMSAQGGVQPHHIEEPEDRRSVEGQPATERWHRPSIVDRIHEIGQGVEGDDDDDMKMALEQSLRIQGQAVRRSAQPEGVSRPDAIAENDDDDDDGVVEVDADHTSDEDFLQRAAAADEAQPSGVEYMESDPQTTRRVQTRSQRRRNVERPAELAADLNPPLSGGNSHVDLPKDVNIEEARMLEAAYLGVPYHGTYPQGDPAALERKMLRDEIDAAYEESLRVDREKAQEREEARRQQLEERDRIWEQEMQQKAELASKQSRLPAEPAESDSNAIMVQIRLPDGSRLGRRFCQDDLVSFVFDFIDVSSPVGLTPGKYRLVRQFPRAVLSADMVDSLADVGLTNRQEALFVEKE